MVDGQRKDDGPWLYHKLTNEPKGSGELKIKRKQRHFWIVNIKTDIVQQ